MTYDCFKRSLDLVAGAALWLVAAPAMLAIALAVRLCLGKPVFFKQVRPGLGGDPFVMYKFRTMADKRDQRGALLPDADRLTPLGRWLRRTSLDELPELINVLRGDMSLVGPRPLLMEYLPLYTPHQARRHKVKPGITGWAQINGRNAIAWEHKFDLDVWYVEHCRLGLDLNILGRTLAHLARPKGVNLPGHATAPRFTGGREASVR